MYRGVQRPHATLLGRSKLAHCVLLEFYMDLYIHKHEIDVLGGEHISFLESPYAALCDTFCGELMIGV